MEIEGKFWFFSLKNRSLRDVVIILAFLFFGFNFLFGPSLLLEGLIFEWHQLIAQLNFRERFIGKFYMLLVNLKIHCLS